MSEGNTNPPRICVCGLDEMADVVAGLRPGHLISLLPAREQPPTPPQVRPSDHLRILVDDVVRADENLSVPESAHVEQLVGFLRTCSPRASIVIHCLAGISRSPAAALIALALEAPGRDLEAARLLRAAAPFADPNRLLVEIADLSLQRGGALVAALEAMGEPMPPIHYETIVLPRLL